MVNSALNRQLFSNFRKLLPRNTCLIVSLVLLTAITVLLSYRENVVYLKFTLAAILYTLSRVTKDYTISRYQSFQSKIEEEVFGLARKQLALGVKEAQVIEAVSGDQDPTRIVIESIKAYALPLMLTNVETLDNELILSFVLSESGQETLDSDIVTALLVHLRSRLNLMNQPVFRQINSTYKLIINLEQK